MDQKYLLCFGSGKTLEYFQLSATLSSVKDRLNKILRGKATFLATGFNILLLIPSGPPALFEFKISIRVLISSGVHIIFDNLLRHFNSKVGSWQLSSFIVEIDVKYVFKLSALA